jgi:hypothetical protein
MKKREEMRITEAELSAMTRDLAEVGNDVSVHAMRESIERWGEDLANSRREHGLARPSRRTFLMGAGALVAGGGLLAACSSSSSPSASSRPKSTTRTSAPYPANLTGDLKVAALAASLENLAVFAYKAGIQAATAGKLGTVPPAVVTFAETALSQHQQHAAAWNALLTGAGHQAVTETDPALTPTVRADFAKVTNVVGLAKLALTLENVAAQTYQVAATTVESPHAISTAATIQPVEMQHAAILYFVLGQYPVPNAFDPTSDARPTSDLDAA